MFSFERKSLLLEFLKNQGSAAIKDLASRFEVTEETIRRDIRDLEKEGVVVKTHGAVIWKGEGEKEYPLRVREIQKKVEKEHICICAAQMISQGDTIFLDNSSTTVGLLKHVDRSISFTVITNSVYVMYELSRLGNDKITGICTGGMYNISNMALYGDLALLARGNFMPEKAFLSCKGMSTKNGFTDGTYVESQTKKEWINQCRQKIFLVDSSKFETSGPVAFVPLEAADIVITDNEMPPSLKEYYENHSKHTKVIVCK